MGNANQPAAGRFTLEDASFEPPADYNDVTNYAYKKEPDEVPRLKVHYVPNLDAVGGLDAAIKDYEDRAVKFLLGQVESRSSQPTPVGELMTMTLVFTFPGTGPDDPYDRYREFCGFGRFPNGAGVQIEYVTPAEDAAGQAVFETIMAHVHLAGTAAPGDEPVPGFIRRQAGAVIVAVPVDLQPPSSFHFVRESGRSKARLTVKIAETADEAQTLLDEHQEALGIAPDQRGALKAAPAPVRLVQEARRSGSKGDVVRTVCHEVKPVKHAQVVITGQATDDWHDRLLGDFDRLAGSTREGWR